MVSAPFSSLTLCTCMGIFSTVRQYTIPPTKNLLVRLNDGIESIQSFCECVYCFRDAHIHECDLVVSWNDVGSFQRHVYGLKILQLFRSGYVISLMFGQLLFIISSSLIIKQLPINSFQQLLSSKGLCMPNGCCIRSIVKVRFGSRCAKKSLDRSVITFLGEF